MPNNPFDDKTIISPRSPQASDSSASSDDPLVGQRIGNYQVLSVLGRGGFGSVYKAEDTKLGRMVALKFLNQTTDTFHSELFEREAKALGTLSKHPNIVQIHSWDEHEGKNFFVLEYMELSVADLLEASPDGLPPALAIRIIAECADALAFAHESCILHRDIKSPNILLEHADGVAKIADFGLARICGTSNNTIEGSVIGSPAYMAPEQARGGEITPQCDIYSLGATLYELLSGQAPFMGKSVLEILEKVRNNDRIALKTRTPHLPPALYGIVDQATAPKPEDRFASAADFAQALRAIEIVDAPEILPAPQKKSPWIYIAVILCLAFWVGIAYLFMNDSASPDSAEVETAPTIETPAETPQPTIADAAPEKAPEPVVSPDPAPEPAPVPPAEETPPPEEPQDPTLKEEAVQVLRENKEEIADALIDRLRKRQKNKGK